MNISSSDIHVYPLSASYTTSGNETTETTSRYRFTATRNIEENIISQYNNITDNNSFNISTDINIDGDTLIINPGKFCINGYIFELKKAQYLRLSDYMTLTQGSYYIYFEIATETTQLRYDDNTTLPITELSGKDTITGYYNGIELHVTSTVSMLSDHYSYGATTTIITNLSGYFAGDDFTTPLRDPSQTTPNLISGQANGNGSQLLFDGVIYKYDNLDGKYKYFQTFSKPNPDTNVYIVLSNPTPTNDPNPLFDPYAGIMEIYTPQPFKSQEDTTYRLLLGELSYYNNGWTFSKSTILNTRVDLLPMKIQIEDSTISKTTDETLVEDWLLDDFILDDGEINN